MRDEKLKKIQPTEIPTTKRTLREGNQKKNYILDFDDEFPRNMVFVRDEDRPDVKYQIKQLYEDMKKGELPIQCFDDPDGKIDPKTGERTKLFQCQVCSKTMRDEINVERHVNFLHTMKKWYKCDQCYIAKLDSFMIRSHLMEEHEISRTIKSIEDELCIKDEVELRKLKDAKIKSRIEKFIKTSKEKELSRKMLEKNRSPINSKHSPRNCDIGTSSPRRSSVEENVETGGRQSYKCSFCDTVIKDKYNLNRHINALHTMTKWYKCNKCSETTLYRNNHIHHMKRVHDIDASGVQVDKTMIVTDEEEIRQLREEKINAMSNATVLFRCSDCDIAEIDPHNLAVHLKTQHGKTKTVNEIRRGLNIVQRNGLTDAQKSGDFNCSPVVIAAGTKKNIKRRSVPIKRQRPRSSSSSESSSSESSSSSDESDDDDKDEDEKSIQSTASSDKTTLINSPTKPGPNASKKQKTELTCSYCDKELMSQELFEDHVNSQHEKQYCYKCSECDFVGFWARGMKLHLYNKHNIFVEQEEIGKQYKCHDKNLIENVGKKDRKGGVIKPSPARPSRSARSSKSTNRKSITVEEPKKNEDHQQLVPVPKEKQRNVVEKVSDDGKTYYLCPYCSVESIVLRNIKDHINSKHEHSSWYTCFKCEFISFWTSSIRDHLNEKHNIHLNSFQEVDVKCLSSNDNRRSGSVLNTEVVGNKGNNSTNSEIHVSGEVKMNELWKEELNGDIEPKMNSTKNANEVQTTHSLRKSRKAVSYKEDDFDDDDRLNSKIKLLSAWTRLPSASPPHNSSNSNSPRKERKERKDLLCPYCEKDLLNKENYEGHINAKHEKKFCYKCPSCNYVSLWRKGFREHLLNSHKIEEKNNEEIDNKYKNYERQLIDKVRHKRTSDELSYEQCETLSPKKAKKEDKCIDPNMSPPSVDSCTKNTNPLSPTSTSTFHQMVSTPKSIEQKTNVTFDCNKCKKDFAEENIWAIHMEKIHGVPQILLLCPECEYRSQHPPSFSNHLVNVHEVFKVNDLDIYKVTIKEVVPLIRSANKSDKTQHRNYVNASGEYCCPRCDYTYETINLLEPHCKEGHGPQTWYLCPCCPYENRFLQGVRVHLSTKHSESANSWGSNLEGRKVDKSRFILHDHRSPPGKSMSSDNLMSSVKNHSPDTSESMNLNPSTSKKISSQSKNDIDCVIIDED